MIKPGLRTWWGQRSPQTREFAVGIPIALLLWLTYGLVMSHLVEEHSVMWELIGGVVGLVCGVAGLLLGYWVEDRRAP